MNDTTAQNPVRIADFGLGVGAGIFLTCFIAFASSPAWHKLWQEPEKYIGFAAIIAAIIALSGTIWNAILNSTAARENTAEANRRAAKEQRLKYLRDALDLLFTQQKVVAEYMPRLIQRQVASQVFQYFCDKYEDDTLDSDEARSDAKLILDTVKEIIGENRTFPPSAFLNEQLITFCEQQIVSILLLFNGKGKIDSLRKIAADYASRVRDAQFAGDSALKSYAELLKKVDDRWEEEAGVRLA